MMMNALLGVLLVVSCVVSSAKVDYSGHSVLRVTPENDATLDMLRNLMEDSHSWNLDFLAPPRRVGDLVDIQVSGAARIPLETYLKANGVDYVVHVEDIQELIDEEDRNQLESMSDNEEEAMSSMMMPTTRYFRLYQINRFMRKLCRTQSQACRVLNIGKSYERRNMLVMRIGSACKSKPTIWIDGGIHAREWITPATAVYMMAKFMEKTPEMTELLERVTIYIMPNANPDGYEYSHTRDRMWRKTRQPHGRCFGADPNRNWDIHFGGAGTSDNPCSNMYHGPRPFSEPAIKAISDFLYKHRDTMILYQSMHSYSQVWLYPWSYDKTVPRNVNDLNRLGRIAAAAQLRETGLRYEVGQTSTIMYAAAGSSHDWAMSKGNATYAISVELPDTGRYGFLLPARYIAATGRGMVAANIAMIKEVLRLTHN